MTNPIEPSLAKDPLLFKQLLWPHVRFYDKQVEILESLVRDDETIVPAGNKLGKDFVAGFAVLWFFLTRRPCRIITTSVKADHLKVLWGEINNFISESQYPLRNDHGGPLIVNHLNLRYEGCQRSYASGMVAAEGAAMQGHHVARIGDGIPRTMFVADEASGVPNQYYTMADTWADCKLIIGNPWDCENFFKWSVKGRPATADRGGDLLRPDGSGYYRKIIKIMVTDSPNVKQAEAEIAKGMEPSGHMVVPGVKTYREYQENLIKWDDHQKTVSLWADWYEGAEVRMFPDEWIQAAYQRYAKLKGHKRVAKSIGVDSAMGGDKTAWYVFDEFGPIHKEAMKTPDTNIIPSHTLMLARRFGVPYENIMFDLGGGGKQHADRLRAGGFHVRGVYFGASVAPEKKRGITPLDKRKLEDEERQVYKNRRAEMFGLFREGLDPEQGTIALDPGDEELANQLRVFPLLYDEEGRLYLPPKNKPNQTSTVQSLVEMIGHSPDEADAAVMAWYAQQKKPTKRTAGAIL